MVRGLREGGPGILKGKRLSEVNLKDIECLSCKSCIKKIFHPKSLSHDFSNRGSPVKTFKSRY